MGKPRISIFAKLIGLWRGVCSNSAHRTPWSGLVCELPTPQLQRFAENLQIKKAKNETAHVQYLKDQRKNWKGSLFAFLEVARTLQTAVASKKKRKAILSRFSFDLSSTEHAQYRFSLFGFASSLQTAVANQICGDIITCKSDWRLGSSSASPAAAAAFHGICVSVGCSLCRGCWLLHSIPCSTDPRPRPPEQL